MDRAKVLDTAKQIVTQNREAEYGSPHENLKCANEFFQVYLKYAMSPHITDVMVLLKMARVATGRFNEDNYIDVCGYAALSCEMNEENTPITEEIMEELLK